VGDVVEGTVMSVKPYGAFVDIGGASGLLHISQISHDRITNVDKVRACNLPSDGGKVVQQRLVPAVEGVGVIIISSSISSSSRGWRLFPVAAGSSSSAAAAVSAAFQPPLLLPAHPVFLLPFLPTRRF
jgi:hypothetical protein